MELENFTLATGLLVPQATINANLVPLTRKYLNHVLDCTGGLSPKPQVVCGIMYLFNNGTLMPASYQRKNNSLDMKC